MFVKKKKSLITLLAVIYAAVIAMLGALMLAPKTRTANATVAESGSFRVYGANGIFEEGYEDITSAWDAAKSLSWDIETTTTVKMFADATISDTLALDSWYYNVALDLNGHKLSIDSVGKSVIESNGEFLLKDSDPEATNTVISYAKGNTPREVTVAGGVITGANGKPALNINDGDFNMEGGTIAGNIATGIKDAAVYAATRSINLSGGVITENLNTAGGVGGLYTYSWTSINVSGAPIIDGNGSCTDINDSERNAGNLYFNWSVSFVVEGALNDGAGNNTRIGVTFCNDYSTGTTITKNYNSFNADVAPGTYFYSDDPNMCASLYNNEVRISRHTGSGDYTIAGDKHSRTCSNCGATFYEAHSYNKSSGKCACGDQAQVIVTVSSTTKGYKTIEEAFAEANNATNAATIRMFADAEASSTLEVSAGKNITLELNGKKLAYTGANGSVIKVDGTFTLKDGGTGSHEIPSPVTNETVTVSGGLITGGKGNGTETPLGGAVYVTDTGVFTMSGGTLAGNTAIGGQGGAVHNQGTFAINNGSISHNKSGRGGGVYNNGTFNVRGTPMITYNKANADVNNIFNVDDRKINITGNLIDGAQLGIGGSGEVAIGFTQTTGKPSDFLIPDDPEYVCIYVSDKTAGTVNIRRAHTGAAATCTQKAVCDMCDEVYGEVDDNAHTLDKLVILSATDKYSAFDAFDIMTAVVYTHCSACDRNVDKLAASDMKVTYGNGNCLHTNDTHVRLSATVGDRTLDSDGYSVTVSKYDATIVWEYTTSAVNDENAWVWNEITDGSHFVYDGTSKSYRVRARFTGATNDPNKDAYYYRAVDNTLLVDGTSEKGIENAAIYVLSLDESRFADYSFTNNNKSIEVKPYEITLSDAEAFHWTLDSDKGSFLRNAYIEKTEDNVYLYYDPTTGGADNRTYVTRSVVRYRGENTGLNIVLNGGEVADLFIGTGKRSNVEYSGATAVGAVGKYTAIATLTLNDVTNYKYVGGITVADSRGMTIVISENGTKAVITKDWYVATINNGLLMPDGGEYAVNGWAFGEDFTPTVPKLEHGDDNFDSNNISASDKRISFGLFTDVDTTEIIGETFYRYNFADYINKSMPSGNYVLRASVSEVTDSDGLAYPAFTRTFAFTVKKGTLDVTDTLNGKQFEHVYNRNVQLFENEFEPTVAPLKFGSAAERMGIWKNGKYDRYYGKEHYMTFHLARWQTDGGIGYEFVTRTQLENTLDKKQAPREVDTYIVQYKISALNYEDYGGNTSFTVKINKQKVAVPQNVTASLIKEYVYKVPDNADYRIEGNATFTQTGTHTVILKLLDAENYEWEEGNNIEGDTAKITVTLAVHAHVYGEWTVDKAPTCTENGSRSKKCALCDDIAKENVSALGHDITQHKAKPSTCTENGWNAYENCSRCDYTTYAEIAAGGHHFATDFTVDKSPTCTEKGSRSRHCLNCEEKTEVTEIAVTPHSLTHVEHKEATADAAGNIEYWACADCAGYFSDENGETEIADRSSVEIPMLIANNNAVKKLSVGAVIGIVIACVVAVLVAAYAAGYFFLYRKGILLKGKAFDAIFVPMNSIFKKKTKE